MDWAVAMAVLVVDLEGWVAMAKAATDLAAEAAVAGSARVGLAEVGLAEVAAVAGSARVGLAEAGSAEVGSAEAGSVALAAVALVAKDSEEVAAAKGEMCHSKSASTTGMERVSRPRSLSSLSSPMHPT